RTRGTRWWKRLGLRYRGHRRSCHVSVKSTLPLGGWSGLPQSPVGFRQGWRTGLGVGLLGRYLWPRSTSPLPAPGLSRHLRGHPRTSSKFSLTLISSAVPYLVG